MSHIFANDATSFTFVDDNGDKHVFRFEDIPHYLTVQLLEENWRTYKYLLSVYTEYRNLNNITEEKIQRKLNDTSQYKPWYSTHIQSLSYLVGEQVEKVCQKKIQSQGTWYGRNTSIPDQEACEIMDLMIQNGAKIDIPNYYDETILQSFARKGSLNERTNNEKFHSKLKEHFSKL